MLGRLGHNNQGLEWNCQILPDYEIKSSSISSHFYVKYNLNEMEMHK